ncbi:MAG: PAS domain S-box protein [Desulfobacteraceae bacterium]|nr:PAS domain S-box protein [Desulfobacteraceae bacterium]
MKNLTWESIFSSIPNYMMILDHESRIVIVNDRLCKKLGITADAAVGKYYTDIFCSGNGRGTETNRKESSPDCSNLFDTRQTFDLGEFFIESKTPLFDKFGDLVGSVCVIRDTHRMLTHQKKLKSRDAILSAVTQAAEHFLRRGALDECTIVKVLCRLGKAVSVSRVYVFKNHTSASGVSMTSQQHEWSAPGVFPQKGNPGTTNLPWLSGGLNRWRILMKQGHTIKEIVRRLPREERRVLAPQGIKSIMVAPIYVSDKWWGFIGFDDCWGERYWSNAESDMLKTAGAMLGALLEHDKARRALSESEQHLRSFMENANEFVVYRLSFDKNASAAVDVVFVSPSITDVLGTRDTRDYAQWFNHIHPDDKEVISDITYPDKNVIAQLFHPVKKEWRWVHAIARSLENEEEGIVYVNGIIFDITAQMRVRKELEIKQMEFQESAESLSQTNTALRVLLKKLEEDRKELEEKVLFNVNDAVKPYLNRIKDTKLSPAQQACLNLIEANLDEIISPFSRRLTYEYLNFTPAEIQIANLVKQGRTTKEIAKLVNRSPRTIDAYRDSIRNKLGIRHKKLNLRMYLLSLD